MTLPPFILKLMERLEENGCPVYAVGGCVRDMLLGLEPHDYDLCTAALPEQTRALFQDHRLVLAGQKHGTVGVITPEGVVEITTFRREGTYGDNRHPDWVEFVPSLEEDLARRDFTVNAMAFSPTRGFADPFGGQRDLKQKILRAVGTPRVRFEEDALRILRGVRFAARFGLTPEPETLEAMNRQAGLLDRLARERVFDELSRLLPLLTLEDLERYKWILAGAIAEIGPMIGFDQRSPHHAYDLYGHTAHVTAGVSRDPVLRWAALLHDTGKIAAFTQDENGRGHFYGHAGESARIADRVLRQLKAPNALREQVLVLIRLHMNRLEPDEKLLRRRLSQYGSEAVFRLLQLQKADLGGKGVPEPEQMELLFRAEAMTRDILSRNACLSLKDLAVNGRDLLKLGYAGPEIGRALQTLLNLVLEQKLPNTREALLQALSEQEETP